MPSFEPIVEADPRKAADRLKASAVMTPGLQGKVGFGYVDVYRALTQTFSLPSTGPVLYTEPDSPRAIALDSVTMVRDPFGLTNPFNLTPTDRQTRITILAGNFDPAAVSVQAQDMQGQYMFPVEGVFRVPNTNFIQITAKVPTTLTKGDYWLTFTTNGTQSNRGLVTFH